MPEDQKVNRTDSDRKLSWLHMRWWWGRCDGPYCSWKLSQLMFKTEIWYEASVELLQSQMIAVGDESISLEDAVCNTTESTSE